MPSRRRLLITAGGLAVVLAGGGLYAVERLFGRLLHGRAMRSFMGIPSSDRSRAAVERVTPRLAADLAAKGLAPGAPLFVRVFKEEKELEVWLLDAKTPAAAYRLFHKYPILSLSGALGPKLAEGDCQAPEGFYSVAGRQLNPLSRFHLSFDIGYPNEYDRFHGRTGSAIMVHGGSASIGCFAMGDAAIEEIYTLAETALRGGQDAFAVHVFPFRMTDARLQAARNERWVEFWRNLKAGYDCFEGTRVPPRVTVENGRYGFTPCA